VLYLVTKHLTTFLAERGCPYRVIYGPTRFEDVALVDSRIVVERPREQSDTIAVPRTTKLNPARRAVRGIAGVVRIFAHSTLPGARVEDHEHIADQLADMVIVALQRAAQAELTSITMSRGGLLSKEDAGVTGAEQWPGVVYEIPIEVLRGVYDRTWAGSARDEVDGYTIETSGTCVLTATPPDED
jgi:hypothetical protein